MAEPTSVRHATSADLPSMSEVFYAAFPESVRHYRAEQVHPRAMQDIFAICLDAEPEAVFVTEIDHRIVGYIIAPSHLSRLAPTAFRHGHLSAMFGRWVSGQYNLGLPTLRTSITNWFAILREARQGTELNSDARILSIAVHPDTQGHGLGKVLMDAGMQYLSTCGVSRIRLEVRPDNPAAMRLYARYGFQTVGETHDTQGTWLIMLKELS